MDVEPNGISFGSKSKGKLSPRSYPIQCERKWKYSFLSVETYKFCEKARQRTINQLQTAQLGETPRSEFSITIRRAAAREDSVSRLMDHLSITRFETPLLYRLRQYVTEGLQGSSQMGPQ